MRFFVLIVFLLAHYSTAVLGKCEKSETLSKSKMIIDLLDKQLLQVSEMLEGTLSDPLVAKGLFGHAFEFSNTNVYISNLHLLNKEQNGVTSENQHLLFCLNELNLKDKSSQLIEKSKLLNLAKIKLFENNEKLNDSIRKGLETQDSLPAIQKEIDKETKESEQIKRSLERSVLKVAGDISEELDHDRKELALYKNALTKIQIDLIDKKIEYNKSLEEKLNYFTRKSKVITQLESRFNENKKKQMQQYFIEIESIWMEITKENIYQLIKNDLRFKLPEIPSLLKIDNASLTKEIAATELLRTNLEELRLETIKQLSDKKNKEIKLLNELFISINELRSKSYSRLSISFLIDRLFTKEYLYLLKNELFSSPYRVMSYFYSKYLYFNEKLTSSKEGALELFSDFIKYLLLMGMFFGFKFSFEKLNVFLDVGQEKLLRKYKRFILIRIISGAWNKFKNNAIEFMWLILIHVIKTYEIVENIRIILEVIEVFLIARIIRSLVVLFLGSISKIDVRSFENFKIRAKETADHFTNIYLFYSLTMIFIDATMGKVYIYSIVNVIVLIYSSYRITMAASKWDEEFSLYLDRQFAGIIIAKIEKILVLFPKKLHSVFKLISIIILSFFDILIKTTENFEISKKISANLFKKQIENIEAKEGDDEKVPASYKDEFSFASLSREDEYVIADEKLERKLKIEIDEWLNDRSDEHTVVIYGDKGIGKTTLLHHVGNEIVSDSNSTLSLHYAKMPSKTLSKNKLHSFINSIFKIENIDGEFDLYHIDKNLPGKTIVIIDEAQNIFLSQTGGFECYYELINLINLNTKNLFWIMSFNKYSWLYLDRAFGRNQFFRNVFELKGWSDLKIKELIMRRHDKSEFRLSYDLLINATRSQDEMDRYSSIESKFFKLLWELSRGNPRSALYLWLTALSRKNRTVLNVNIPKEAELSGLGKLPDDLLFVVAHVLKHENLSSSEIESSSNLPKGLVRNAIKVCLERKFFYKDERGRYMIDIVSQYGLVRYLRIKNFVYGN